MMNVMNHVQQNLERILNEVVIHAINFFKGLEKRNGSTNGYKLISV